MKFGIREMQPAVAAGPAPARDRFPKFVTGGRAPADVLDGLCVMVLGCGAVGRRAALHLARDGVGCLLLVDPKTYERPGCVRTQPIGPDELGGAKAEGTARACKTISPRTRVFYFRGPQEDLPLAAYVGVDAVIMATDNLFVEAGAGQRCLYLGIPLVHAAVHGETMVAQVRVYANAVADSPTPACNFSDEERDLMHRQVRFSCEGPSAGQAQVSAPPTMSTSSLCALAADLAVNQFLRHVLALGEPVADTMLEYCAFTHRTHVDALRRRAGCSCDHARFRIVPSDRPLGERTPAELVAAAGATEDLAVTVGGLDWVDVVVCGDCARPRPFRRFVALGTHVAGICDRCAGPLVCQAFHRHPTLPASLLEPVRAFPLGDAGAKDADWVLVRDGLSGVLHHHSLNYHEAS
jgi:molybdopterin/thiamine biosynthesis adenylyltransferase